MPELLLNLVESQAHVSVEGALLADEVCVFGFGALPLGFEHLQSLRGCAKLSMHVNDQENRQEPIQREKGIDENRITYRET